MFSPILESFSKTSDAGANWQASTGIMAHGSRHSARCFSALRHYASGRRQERRCRGNLEKRLRWTYILDETPGPSGRTELLGKNAGVKVRTDFQSSRAAIFVDAGATNTLVVGTQSTIEDRGAGTLIVPRKF